LVSAYWMLKRDEPYHDLGADWHRRRSEEAHTRRLVAQLKRLGNTVTLTQPPKHHSLISVEFAARRCRSLPCGRAFTGLCPTRSFESWRGYVGQKCGGLRHRGI
jgi:hypothetical protein